MMNNDFSIPESNCPAGMTGGRRGLTLHIPGLTHKDDMLAVYGFYQQTTGYLNLLILLSDIFYPIHLRHRGK